MDKFEVGDRVNYISGKHGMSDSNPLVRTSYECMGTIDSVYTGGVQCTVQWDNGEHNSYSAGDLASVKLTEGDKPEPNMAFRIKKLNVTDHTSGYGFYAGKKITVHKP